jgi:hypothetical protein
VTPATLAGGATRVAERYGDRMTEASIGAAYPSWSRHNTALREVVGGVTAEHLAIQPTPDRWPLWASIGHLACQRVFWLCVFGDAPGAETTPFTNSGHMCPGDDDLEHVLGPGDLVDALDSTFAIVRWCIDTWTLDDLREVISHPGDDRRHTRGWVLQRVFAHDVSHITELNETLGRQGLPQVDLWE